MEGAYFLSVLLENHEVSLKSLKRNLEPLFMHLNPFETEARLN
jgi:hypothetical protein